MYDRKKHKRHGYKYLPEGKHRSNNHPTCPKEPSEARPNTNVVRGSQQGQRNHEYLIPLPSPSKKGKKKKARFSNPEVNDDQVRSPNVVRIKLIISKQELQELLQNGGVSAQDIASHNIQSKQTTNGIIAPDVDDDSCRGSKPVLQTIAEVN
ncbi:hypothetical protein PVK06_037048 [Gossypium arboreum]|uniref:Uncharacterized protein n=1 Tax=Gossypium arboreum TaxID=29729 RepID=A0ABR0MW68_GOSAR|nr:hypothetical protein PVK06_037048 [Gossypium arboreum]